MIQQQTMGMTPPVNNMASVAPPPTAGIQNTPQPAIAPQQPVQAPNTGGMTATAPPMRTPGGLQGTSQTPQYGLAPDSGQGAQGGNSGGNMAYSGMGSQFNPNSAPQNNSVGDFSQYEDSALANAMRTLQPQMDANNAAFEQQMVSRGIQPGTAQYDAQRSNLDRRNNDMLSQAEYGAQQQGLQAQQQAWGQQYGYDQLANALNQANIGAQASMYGSDASANASMHNAGLANALGFGQLNENARQADMNDIYRTQGQDINAALGWANHGLGQQGMDINAFNAQNNANNQWWNQISGMTANAPGVNFNPTGNVAGQMQNAGQNMYNAQNAQNQGWANLAGGLMGLSDERLKENIEYIETIDNVNVYEFDYIDKSHGKDRYRGVMAQQVKGFYPDAVFTDSSGYYKVDYSKLPVNMEIVHETLGDNYCNVDYSETLLDKSRLEKSLENIKNGNVFERDLMEAV